MKSGFFGITSGGEMRGIPTDRHPISEHAQSIGYGGNMATFYEYDLGDGATILIEGPEVTKSVTRGGQSVAQDQVIQAGQNFSAALKGAKLQAAALLKEIEDLKVTGAEIKFGLTTSGELGLMAIGKIGVGINYEVTLKWGK